jgi:aldehyde dehydrogenase (NAD+)
VINPSALFVLDLIPSVSDISHLATGKLTTKVSEATSKDVDIAVEAARNAFENTWGLNASGAQRAALLNKLGDLMVQHKDELAAIEALDNGKYGWFS